jgi:hypothetical protein
MFICITTLPTKAFFCSLLPGTIFQASFFLAATALYLSSKHRRLMDDHVAINLYYSIQGTN